MCQLDRRTLSQTSGIALIALLLGSRAASAQIGTSAFFVAEAERMRRAAVTAGDQAYGAVLVQDSHILGYGPSRVVADRNTDAHAERVALWEAQRKTGSLLITGSVIYATSRPCLACQKALAAAGVARMFVGPTATDQGAPRSD